ncbi:MAG: shikimate dehydrogenase [Desulfohalobiaceae bacterium]|nr:shikimate dehydrogenase [Desulfohalobiaceae bacterium]
MTNPAWERRLFGVVGHPLEQSLSPLIHNWGFTAHELPWTYLAWDIPPGHLPHFSVALRTLPISGVSVTIPHKLSIMPYADRLTQTALSVGSVNTLYWREGELWGENTDLAGFLSPLLARNEDIRSALILGAGGAALACIQGLRRMGVGRIELSARDATRARRLAGEQEAVAVPWEQRHGRAADLLINATPLGMKGKAKDSLPLDDPAPERFPLVYDLVYNPIRTRLLRRAEEAGCRTISGLAMFVNQAREQFRIWSGLDLEEESLVALVRDHLDRE